MSKFPKIPILELHLDRDSVVPLYQQLYESLRRLMLSGQVAAGFRVPSTRTLARELGISRSTARNAYEQLLAEGYLEGVTGSGTRVSAALPDEQLKSTPHRLKPPRDAARKPRLSLRGQELINRTMTTPPDRRSGVAFDGGAAVEEFPFQVWNRLHSRHRSYGQAELMGYGDAAGFRPLREAISNYVQMARSVKCGPDRVFILNNWQRGVQLLSSCLLDSGDSVWVEDPGYYAIGASLAAIGAKVEPVPVDAGGLSVQAGIRTCPDARMACVTPSHQYPSGVVMSLARRFQLLNWASANESWILEDDFRCEYRYSGCPIPSLQGLDESDRVIYLGTFSSVLFPAIQIGYLVVPPQWIETFTKVLHLSGHHTLSVDQAVLADFIRDGHFERHLRRMRKLYESRQHCLVNATKRYLEPWVRMEPASAGMHLIGWMPKDTNDVHAANIAAKAGIRLTPLSDHYRRFNKRPGLMFGYTAVTESKIQSAVRRLAATFKDIDGFARFYE